MLTARALPITFARLLACALLLSCAVLTACGDAAQLRSGAYELSVRLSDADLQQPALRVDVRPGDRIQFRVWSPRAELLRWSDQEAAMQLPAEQWQTISRTVTASGALELRSVSSERSILVLHAERG